MELVVLPRLSGKRNSPSRINKVQIQSMLDFLGYLLSKLEYRFVQISPICVQFVKVGQPVGLMPV